MLQPENSSIENPFPGEQSAIRHTVMVVEDNEWVQNYVKKIFSADYEVLVAADGIFALEHLENTVPDLIILDIMMPRMDGNELFAKLKEHPDWAHVPVIMFSAMSSEENRLEGLEKGADDYIGKPFNPRELVARARNLIQLRHQEKELVRLNADLETRVQRQVAVILSERQRYERELIVSKERAEESDRLKSFILRNMSHEIRTPITNILGFAEILSERVEDEDRQFTAYIEANGKRLLDTVTSILDFSKLTTDSFEIAPALVEIAEVMPDASSRYEAAAEAKGLAIKVDVQGDSIEAEIDRSAVDRILNHLIANAIKFTAAGEITLRSCEEGENVVFEVQDTGVGISDDFKSEMFSPFKQESVGEARSFEGTGLGLSICKRLVDVMNGTITFESVKGEGSTFGIRLPKQAVRKMPPKIKSAERPPVAHGSAPAVTSGKVEAEKSS